MAVIIMISNSLRDLLIQTSCSESRLSPAVSAVHANDVTVFSTSGRLAEGHGEGGVILIHCLSSLFDFMLLPTCDI